MKNKKIFFYVYLILMITINLSLLTLYILGNQTRVGYISEFKLLENNIPQLNTNQNITNYNYHFRIKYYSKIFRNSDIYGVYPDINNILNENNFIKNINLDYSGSPFGILTSSKELNIEKIDINYTLKIKNNIITLFCYLLIVFIIIIIYIYFNNFLKTNIEIKVYEVTDKYNKILNVLFYSYLFILSMMLLSSQFFTPIKEDDWAYLYSYINYNIYNFTGYFWQRGRHFADILMSLSMHPFGNIFVSFGTDPFYTAKILSAIFNYLYIFLLSISFSIFIWLLNNKKNYKLIFLTIFLFISCMLINKSLYYVQVSAYLGTMAISLLIWMPILYYFIYNRELILMNNKVIYYSIFTYFVYFAMFTLETSSLVIVGITFFMLIYYVIIAKHKIDKTNIHIILFMILFILLGSISFLLTLFFSGRGKHQFERIGDSSLFSNISTSINNLAIYEKFLLLFSITYIIYFIYCSFKLKKLDREKYINSSILFVGILGSIGFVAIKVPHIYVELILIFSIFLLILLKIIADNTYLSVIYRFILIGIIVIMSLQFYNDYGNNFRKNFYHNGKSDERLLQLFIDADKNGLDEINLTYGDIIKYGLEAQTIQQSSNVWPNIFISQWMYHYGYTKKVIKLNIVN